jgi:hypothetical protein
MADHPWRCIRAAMDSMNQRPSKDLSERLENFAVEIIRIGQILDKTFIGRKLSGQLISSLYRKLLFAHG